MPMKYRVAAIVERSMGQAAAGGNSGNRVFYFVY